MPKITTPFPPENSCGQSRRANANSKSFPGFYGHPRLVVDVWRNWRDCASRGFQSKILNQISCGKPHFVRDVTREFSVRRDLCVLQSAIKVSCPSYILIPNGDVERCFLRDGDTRAVYLPGSNIHLNMFRFQTRNTSSMLGK